MVEQPGSLLWYSFVNYQRGETPNPFFRGVKDGVTVITIDADGTIRTNGSLAVSGNLVVSGEFSKFHARTHESGGGDEVYFSALRHSSLDVTTHDNFRTGPHVSDAEHTELSAAYSHSLLTGNVHGLSFTHPGSGGGLDADLLDGLHASDFALTGHTHQNVDATTLGGYPVSYFATSGHTHSLLHSHANSGYLNAIDQTLSTTASATFGGLAITGLNGVLKAIDGVVGIGATTSDIVEGTNLYYTSGRVSGYILSIKGVSGGIAGLDAAGKVPYTQLPDLRLFNTYSASGSGEMLSLPATHGDLCIRTDSSQTFILSNEPASAIENWTELLTAPNAVTSVNTKLGDVVLTTTDIAEGTNLYFTDARVSGNATVSANTAARHTRTHTLLSSADHSDVSSYINQPVRTVDSPTFSTIKLDTAPQFGTNTLSSSLERGRWSPIYTGIAAGRPLYTDAEFACGYSIISTYNNISSSTAITRTWMDYPTAPNRSGKVVKISNDGSGAAYPGGGGFVCNIQSRPNAVFVERFIAKVPSGKTLSMISNSLGDGASKYWITKNAGTDLWEEYICVSHCGASGSFSTGGHIYVTESGTYDIYIASMQIFDVSSVMTDQALTALDTPKFAGLLVTGNITVTGTVDGVDVSNLSTITTTLSAASHTHSNKTNLDTINQNMGQTASVTFGSILAKHNIYDTRDVIPYPSGYNTSAVYYDFKQTNVLNIASGATPFAALMTLSPWNGDSGGAKHQLAFNNSIGLFWRTGTIASGAFGSWSQLANSGMTNDFSFGGNLWVKTLLTSGLVDFDSVQTDSLTVCGNVNLTGNINVGGLVDGVDIANLSTRTNTISGKVDTVSGQVASMAATGVHTHTNKAYLDSVNQNLSTTSEPVFDALTVNGDIAVAGLVDGIDVFLHATDADIHHTHGNKGYIDSVNQTLAISGSPYFTNLNIFGNIAVSGLVDGVDIAATSHTHANKSNLDSINQTLATSSSPTFDTVYSKYAVLDTRSVSPKPSDYNEGAVSFDFKFASAARLPGSGYAGNFAALATIVPWSNYSGGEVHQIGFNRSDGLYWRTGMQNTSGFGSWAQIAHSGMNQDFSFGGSLFVNTLTTSGSINCTSLLTSSLIVCGNINLTGLVNNVDISSLYTTTTVLSASSHYHQNKAYLDLVNQSLATSGSPSFNTLSANTITTADDGVSTVYGSAVGFLKKSGDYGVIASASGKAIRFGGMSGLSVAASGEFNEFARITSDANFGIGTADAPHRITVVGPGAWREDTALIGADPNVVGMFGVHKSFFVARDVFANREAVLGVSSGAVTIGSPDGDAEFIASTKVLTLKSAGSCAVFEGNVYAKGNLVIDGTVDGIDVAATSHTHANKSNLDLVNQSLATSGSPTFSSIYTSKDTLDGGVYHLQLKLGNGTNRWGIGTFHSETSGDTGSDLYISAHNSSGSWAKTPLVINRASGYVGISTTMPDRTLHVAGDARITGILYSTNNYATVDNIVTKVHGRNHNLLSSTDHADVATYIDQPVLTTSNPSFNSLTTTGTSGLFTGRYFTLFGSLGAPSILQATNVTSVSAGYGLWINYNAYWDGANWIQPRVTTGSRLFSANYHGDFTFRVANSAGTGSADGVIVPYEVAKIDSVGNLTLSGTVNGVNITTLSQQVTNIATTGSHAHANKANLDAINQNLSTSGTATFYRTILDGNGTVLQLQGIDHCYVSFFPRGITSGRQAYFGFGSANSPHLRLANENTSGDLYISAEATRTIRMNRTLIADENVQVYGKFIAPSIGYTTTNHAGFTFGNLAVTGWANNTAKMLIAASGINVYGLLDASEMLSVSGNAVWHAGNFAPSSYSLTSHTHQELHTHSNSGYLNVINQNLATNSIPTFKGLIQRQDSSYGFLPNIIETRSSGTVSGAWIINTTIPRNSNAMFRIRVHGYAYGNQANIDFSLVGFAYSGGTGNVDGLPGSVINYKLEDSGNDWFEKSIGINSDGNVAIVVGDESLVTYYMQLAADYYVYTGVMATSGWSITPTTATGFGFCDLHGPLTSILKNTFYIASDGTASLGVSTNGGVAQLYVKPTTNISALQLRQGDGYTADIQSWRTSGGTVLGSYTYKGNFDTVGTISCRGLTTSAITASGQLSLLGITGVLKANTGIVTGGATTTDLPEGTNLYFTSDRADARITAAKDVAGGIAGLDANGKISVTELPAIAVTDTFVVSSQSAMLALSAQSGDLAIRTDLSKSYILKTDPASTLANWQELLTPTDSVTSVNGKTGVVSLTTSDIAEGTNLYYTEARVSGNATVSANTLARHSRSHSLLSALDHSDVATYLDQPVLTTSTPIFSGVSVSNLTVYSTLNSVTSGELSYLSGVTAPLQSQINSIVASGHFHTNKAQLDAIDQNLSTSSSPSFGNISILGDTEVTGNIATSGYVELTVNDKPATPSAGKVRIYVKEEGVSPNKTTSVVCLLDSGDEIIIATHIS